jgi:hypothetical protein
MGAIHFAPIAEIERLAARIHRSDCDNVVKGTGYMQALAAVVAGSRDNQ